MPQDGPDKEDVLSAVWAVCSPSWEDPQFKLTEARHWWNEYGYLATYIAAGAALRAVIGFSMTIEVPEGAQRGIAVPPPPAEVLAPLGATSRATQIAKAAWDVIAGIGMSDTLGVHDPMLEGQLKQLDSNAKGSALYVFGWWCWEAVQQTADARQEGLDVVAGEVYDALRVELGMEPFDWDSVPVED